MDYVSIALTIHFQHFEHVETIEKNFLFNLKLLISKFMFININKPMIIFLKIISDI